jgi:hypothetical protein
VHLRQKILHIRARLKRKRSPQFAVQGVLDDYIKDLHAVIDQNLKFFLGSLRGVPAGEDCTMRMRGAWGQTVTSRRGDDLFAAGTQDRYVLDQTLATHVKTFGQFAASYRCSVLPHPRDNPASPFVGGSWLGVPEGFVRQ